MVLGLNHSRNHKALLDSIYAETEVVEIHLHHKVRWFGKLAVQTATKWCTALDTGLSKLYRAISGNGVYGADLNDEAQLFGSEDELGVGTAYHDFNEILIVANSSETLYLSRIVWGTGTLAQAVAANQYSEFPFIRGNADKNRKIQEVITPRIPVGYKVWLQTMNDTDNATLDFVVGVHGYDE
jgi:hypothetical protein